MCVISYHTCMSTTSPKTFVNLLSIYISFFSQVKLPVYLNQTRADLLFTLDMTMGGDSKDSKSELIFYERGVALLCSGLSA